MTRPAVGDGPVAAQPAVVLADRVALLEAVFRHIQATRMDGVALLHPGLQVQAVGFEWVAPPLAPSWPFAWGVLVTPWFMNLVRLPLVAAGDAAEAAAQGWARPLERVARVIGSQRIDCLGAEEPALGHFEVCSLFSPMSPFADQAAAVATAREVLSQLRAPPARADRPAEPARRGFLTGRVARAGAAP